MQAAEKHTTGQQSSGNRCDSSRCTTRSSFARPIYLQIRRVMQHHAPHKPGGVPRTAIISQRRLHAKVDTRIRSPRCSSPASSRPCTSRAAACGIPRAISSARSSFASTGPGPLRVPSCALKRKAGSQPTPGPTCHAGGAACHRRRRRHRHRLARPAQQLRALHALFADEVISDGGREQMHIDHPHTAKVTTFVLRLRLGGIVFALDDIPVPVWTARGVRWHERSCRRACARCRRRRRRAKEWVAEGSPCTPSRRLRGRAADAAEREPLQCAQTRLLRPSIGHRGRDRQGGLILPDAAT